MHQFDDHQEVRGSSRELRPKNCAGGTRQPATPFGGDVNEVVRLRRFPDADQAQVGQRRSSCIRHNYYTQPDSKRSRLIQGTAAMVKGILSHKGIHARRLEKKWAR